MATASELDFFTSKLQDAWMPIYIVNNAGKIIFENPSIVSLLKTSHLNEMFVDLFKEKITFNEFRLQAQLEQKQAEYFKRDQTKMYQIRNSAQANHFCDALIIKHRLILDGQENIMIQIEDITEELQLKNQLQYMASFDALTRLPNRHSFNNDLKKLNEEVERYGRKYALFYFDIDDFKCYNDTYDHAFGDHVLKAVANAILATKRKTDLLYRVGGDEFVFIANNINTREQMLAIGKKLAFAVDNIPLEAHPRIKISIGCAQIILSTENLFSDRIKLADKGCFLAKSLKRQKSTLVDATTMDHFTAD